MGGDFKDLRLIPLDPGGHKSERFCAGEIRRYEIICRRMGLETGSGFGFGMDHTNKDNPFFNFGLKSSAHLHTKPIRQPMAFLSQL